jgi:hypothetical protein
MIKSLYRCTGCGEWFETITICGDYTPGEFGPLLLCENDARELAEEMGMEI